MRFVPIEFVRDGCYLAKTIYDNSNRVLLREGVQLTDSLLNKIRLIGVYSLYINDDYSEAMIDDIIKPELRQKAIKTIKETFFSFEKYNIAEVSSKGNRNAQFVQLKEKEKYFQSIGSISKEIVEELLDKKNVLINLVDIKSLDNYTYQHSVNVAVISLILGIQLQLTRPELYDLCMGALVHDIGKVLIPKEIIQKNDILTEEEFTIVKTHVLKGYDYLRGSLDVSAPARVISLQHHERIDGTGYPDKRIGSEVTKLSKIVAIADVYDALTSDRPYRKALSPNDAIEYIMANGATQFDYQIVKAFAKAVVPYPEGTLVKLSNGDIAVVEEVYPNYPLRPRVKVIKSINSASENMTLNLISTLGVVIEGLQYEIPTE